MRVQSVLRNTYCRNRPAAFAFDRNASLLKVCCNQNVKKCSKRFKIMANAHAKEVLQYKERFKKDAEELLLSGFPSTILRLNALILTPKFTKRDFGDMHAALSGRRPPEAADVARDIGDTNAPLPKRAKYDGSCQTRIPARLLETNKCLIDLIETVKPHMVKLVEDTKTMKMWISYMIPKVEGGNNFGVEIQEETLAVVRNVENSAALFYQSIAKYFDSRGRFIKNIIKYPHIEDFKRAVQELDEKEYLSFCLILSDIRNLYCALHDLFLKNLDKLKSPRPNNHTESLY